LASSSYISATPFPVPSVQLPFGIEMQALADYSKGAPTEASMVSSLLVQTMPAMAAMSPLLNLLNVFSALKDFLGDPLKLPPLIAALEKVIAMLDPVPFAAAVKSILLLVISYLKTFIQSVTGLLAYQASIDFSIAAGNPALQASLQAASTNASASIEQLMLTLGPIAPVMDLVKPFLSLSGISIDLPSVSGLQGEKDVQKVLVSLGGMLSDLQQVLEAIPS
jgi:hypothetical protein